MAWELQGNSGTNPPDDFLGTTDEKPVVIKTNSHDAVRINPDGNVGIGTTAPATKLHLAGTDASGFAATIQLQNQNASGANAFIVASDTHWDAGADKLLFGLGAGPPSSVNTKMAIMSNGNVAIGTTDPFDPKLTVISSDKAGIFVQSTNDDAIVAHGAGNGTVLFLNQHGAGDLILGVVEGSDVSFRVLHNCDVQVRGLTLTCDQNVKANFSEVDRGDILERLAAMPIRGWNYKMDPGDVQHIGPTSQDFRAAFGLNGDDDTHISVVDSQGIAFAAIQGLNEKLTAENEYLKAKLNSLETRLAALESNSRDAVTLK